MAKIAIIGAGPAGMMAALQSAQKHTIQIIELNPTPGRKLAATGSGRGNLTNLNVSADSYNGKAEKFVEAVLEQLNAKTMIQILQSVGILTYATDDGWVYPVSNSASNVSELLEAHLREMGVEFILSEKVNRIEKNQNGFTLHRSTDRNPILADAVLAASGGKAAPQLGADMDILQSIMQLGHPIQSVHPALAPITTNPKPIQKLQGVRMDLTLSLYDSKARLGRTTGNAIFTQWGINGPAPMNLSHLVQPGGHHEYWLSIDFLPDQSKVLRELIQQYQSSSIPFLVLLKSILPPKVALLAIDKCGIAASAAVSSVPRTQIEKCFELLTSFQLPVTGVRDFEFAQLSTGGIDLGMVDPRTMMSRKVRNLFFAGEILNVYGPCGGYNLQWAFASGVMAGRTLAALPL